MKTSRRDMAYVLSKKWNGGTTVAGTLICAQLAGINVFATGGIGMFELGKRYLVLVGVNRLIEMYVCLCVAHH